MSGDVSQINGHYYAAKSPGLAFESLLPYLALRSAGGAKPVSDPAGQFWYLNLWGALLPAVMLIMLVRYVTDRFEPGFGTAAAVTLGASTMILPFASLYFAHVLAATLVFGAFVILWRERQGESRLGMVLTSGLLAGLGATVEFPVALIGAILGLYALSRSLSRTSTFQRVAAYAGGVLIGSLPTLLYNRWAFGDPFEFSYANVVSSSSTPDANKAGFFGITAPKFDVLVELLFARIGLLTLMPVLGLGAIGLVLLFRAGRRAEALVAATVVAAYLFLIAGYETPFGGDSPGPRFLIAILPFVALGLASTYRRFPLATAALAICSTVEMAVISSTEPLLAPYGGWFHRLASKDFGATSLELVGIPHGMWLFLLTVGAAVCGAGLSLPRPTRMSKDAGTAVLAVAGWILVTTSTPHLIATDRPWIAVAVVTSTVLVVLSVPRGLYAAWRVWRPPPVLPGP